MAPGATGRNHVRPRRAHTARKGKRSVKPIMGVDSRVLNPDPSSAAYGSASSTCCVCVSGLTRRMTLATVPSAAITNVDRSIPMYVLP